MTTAHNELSTIKCTENTETKEIVTNTLFDEILECVLFFFLEAIQMKRLKQNRTKFNDFFRWEENTRFYSDDPMKIESILARIGIFFIRHSFDSSIFRRMIRFVNDDFVVLLSFLSSMTCKYSVFLIICTVFAHLLIICLCRDWTIKFHWHCSDTIIKVNVQFFVNNSLNC